MRRAAVVQYQTIAHAAEQNRSLIEDVLIELGIRDPGGLDYQVFAVRGRCRVLARRRIRRHQRAVRGLRRIPEFHRGLQQRLAARRRSAAPC